MKKFSVLFVLTAATMAAACSRQDSLAPIKGKPIAQGDTTPAALPAALSDYELVWHDEFDSTALDTTKWRYRSENTMRGYALILRSNVIMSDSGFVRLAAQRDGNNFSASQLATHQTYLQKYGYFEARCRMNRSLGPHSSFWLQSPTMGATNNPTVDGAEIDVFEYHLANGPDIIRQNLHWNGYGVNHRTTGSKETIPGSGNGFHTFGLEWTPNSYIFYVDGIVRWSSDSAVSRRSEFMLLSMEITGFGGDRFAGTYPDYLDVDYVRAYQLNKVTVYKDCNYGGWAKRLAPGNYTLSQLTGMGITNDDISAVTVPPGYSITLYENDNFQGQSLTLTADADCLDASMNDKTSSIKVSKL
ncbi:family 16 glycosylhydrolase [Chitinophaga vietnamensis]|uniref:family 16 glycosylhydrolase n=1 Tax=Chitinophaga vietnamensis TaxID=2593957 RepID=UPI001178AE52|nr:family 16 glycosylhydrolase [Chitinophaga vietnamensis]